MIVLAPAGGKPIESANIQKLFIVSEQEGLAKTVKKLHGKSANPKELKLYLGRSHTQHLFKTSLFFSTIAMLFWNVSPA